MEEAVSALVQWSRVAPETKGFDNLMGPIGRCPIGPMIIYLAERVIMYQTLLISPHANLLEVFDTKLSYRR